jgi:hypothetical protein
MMRYFSACMLLALAALPASANFGLFRRHAGVVTVSYYYVPLPYYVPGTVWPPPAVENIPPGPPPFVNPLPTHPQPSPGSPTPNQAAPQPAPASPADQLPAVPNNLAPAPPIMPPAKPETTTANKVEDAYFKVYTNTGGDRSNLAGRKSVTFWNLTDAALTLKIDGQNQVLAAKSSQSFQMPSDFAWRVEGREAEVGRVPTEQTGVTIVIRR